MPLLRCGVDWAITGDSAGLIDQHDRTQRRATGHRLALCGVDRGVGKHDAVTHVAIAPFADDRRHTVRGVIQRDPAGGTHRVVQIQIGGVGHSDNISHAIQSNRAPKQPGSACEFARVMCAMRRGAAVLERGCKFVGVE